MENTPSLGGERQEKALQALTKCFTSHTVRFGPRHHVGMVLLSLLGSRHGGYREVLDGLDLLHEGMNRAAFFVGRRLICLDLDWFDVVPVVHEECRRSRLSSSMSAWSRKYLSPAACQQRSVAYRRREPCLPVTQRGPVLVLAVDKRPLKYQVDVV